MRPGLPHWRLAFGEVRHARLRPVLHAFRYRAFFLRAPLDELEARAGSWLFGVNRAALVGFRREDHGDGRPLRVWVGAMLREEFPAPFICGRYGGEEFCIVAPGVEKQDFARRLENFRSCVSSKPVQIGALSIVVPVSIGMAEQKASDLESLINAADAQLYTAKREGRDRFVWQA